MNSSHVFPRHCHSHLPVAVAGEGCYLIDKNGKRYLDGSGGAAVSCLGHGHKNVTRAIREQMTRLEFAHTGFFTSEAAERLADLLVENAPAGISRAYFVSGGSEAVEAAIKLARQYYLEQGQADRYKVIARRQSYHGNTLGALAAGGNMWRREPFAPLLMETHHIVPCYRYRGQNAAESAHEYGQRVANELAAKIEELGPESVMAFIAEPVVGATLGAVPAEAGYFKTIRDICNRYGILLILDEVMCGMGRTGTFFACEQDDVIPDIITIAKGLGAGYQPIGAMLCSEPIYSTIEQGSGFFQHGHTYLGHPVACAAGVAVVETLLAENLLQRCMDKGERLAEALADRFAQHPRIGDIRGRGLFRGLEIVADRKTKSPFAPELAIHRRIKHKSQELGLICYPMGGTIDGRQGDHLLLAPPFIISDAEIEELVATLADALEQSIPA